MSIVKLNNNGVKNATAFGSAVTSLGSMTFIKKLTASSSATLSFVDGASSVVLDNTYKEYLFTFKNIHPSTQSHFGFNLSTDGGSNYNVTKTSTDFRVFHQESSGATSLGYEGGMDLAQSTSDQKICENLSTENDGSLSGYLHLFNPSDTTFVKHFIGVSQLLYATDYCMSEHFAGYGNTTSAIDGIIFRMSSGNIDSGDICLYGIA